MSLFSVTGRVFVNGVSASNTCTAEGISTICDSWFKASSPCRLTNAVFFNSVSPVSPVSTRWSDMAGSIEYFVSANLPPSQWGMQIDEGTFDVATGKRVITIQLTVGPEVPATVLPIQSLGLVFNGDLSQSSNVSLGSSYVPTGNESLFCYFVADGDIIKRAGNSLQITWVLTLQVHSTGIPGEGGGSEGGGSEGGGSEGGGSEGGGSEGGGSEGGGSEGGDKPSGTIEEIVNTGFNNVTLSYVNGKPTLSWDMPDEEVTWYEIYWNGKRVPYFEKLTSIQIPDDVSSPVDVDIWANGNGNVLKATWSGLVYF